jgi:hypothetical protein
VSAKFAFIDAEKALYSIMKMCAWIGVSTSGYDEWRDRPPSATAQRRGHLATLIEWIFTDSDQTYGHRRIRAALARQGERVTPELVRAIMRERGLNPCQPRPLRPTTTHAGHVGAIPDLVARDFTADAPGTKLVGDITYLPTWQGWLYLATVISHGDRLSHQGLHRLRARRAPARRSGHRRPADGRPELHARRRRDIPLRSRHAIYKSVVR